MALAKMHISIIMQNDPQICILSSKQHLKLTIWIVTHFRAFAVGQHSPNVSSPIVNAQKCLKIKCVSLTFGTHWQKCGESCGEVHWGVGRGEVRCGEMCGVRGSLLRCGKDEERG